METTNKATPLKEPRSDKKQSDDDLNPPGVSGIQEIKEDDILALAPVIFKKCKPRIPSPVPSVIITKSDDEFEEKDPSSPINIPYGKAIKFYKDIVIPADDANIEEFRKITRFLCAPLEDEMPPAPLDTPKYSKKYSPESEEIWTEITFPPQPPRAQPESPAEEVQPRISIWKRLFGCASIVPHWSFTPLGQPESPMETAEPRRDNIWKRLFGRTPR